MTYTPSRGDNERTTNNNTTPSNKLLLGMESQLKLQREREEDAVSDLVSNKKLKTREAGDGASSSSPPFTTSASKADHVKEANAKNTTSTTSTSTSNTPSNPDTRKCELCQRDRPRSCYGKKQWNKTYGGWNCQDCSAAQRAQQRSDLQELSQQDKQNRHDQKIADQTAKTNGTFPTQRRCLTCHSTKERTFYSGKQWKQLFRECQDCVQLRQDSNNRQPPRAKAITTNNNTAASTIVDRLCSSCCDIKQRPDFSPKQWKNPQDAERLCKDCWAEEEEAKDHHRAIVEAEHDKTKKRCFACHKFKLQRQDYSKKQGSKLYGICAPCVVVLQDDRRVQKTVRICSVCHVSKQWNDFAHEQRKATKTERRCRTCAAEHVRDRAEHRQAERDQKEGCLRRCYTCKIFATQEGFSGRQWTKTYATCKRCSEKEKAVVVVKEANNNTPENENDDKTGVSNTTPESDIRSK